MSFIHKYLNLSTQIGTSQEDDDIIKLQKITFLLLPLIIAPLAILWGSIYIYFGETLSGSIPLSYAIISFIHILYFHKTKSVDSLKTMQLLLVLFLPFFLMWSLGGFDRGSYVFIWAFYAPLAELVYAQKSQRFFYFFSFLVLVAISSILNDWFFENHLQHLSLIVVDIFFFLNIAVGFAGIFYMIRVVIDQKDAYSNNSLEKEHQELLKTSKKLHSANLELENYAHYDSLTQLANRYYFQNTLSKKISYAIRHNKRFALLYIDLDGFKSINDSYGHNIGDEVLQIVGKRLQKLLREEDLLSRVGGDEFTVILDIDESYENIKKISKRIIEEINLDFDSIPESSPLGSSIGISIFPDNAKDMQTLINSADKAMYEVKKSVKNSYKISA